MREEPVLYINGNPYVVREANKPFANLEYTGQSACCDTDTAEAIAACLYRATDARTSL